MLVIKYSLFAVISTIFNLATQYISLHLYAEYGALYVAMLMGTLAGLFTKYVLDKKFIFYHTPKDKSDDAKKFALYTFMGVFTTIIFWGTELGFDLFFRRK